MFKMRLFSLTEMEISYKYKGKDKKEHDAIFYIKQIPFSKLKGIFFLLNDNSQPLIYFPFLPDYRRLI